MNAWTDWRNQSVVCVCVCAWYDWCQWNPLADRLRLPESVYGYKKGFSATCNEFVLWVRCGCGGLEVDGNGIYWSEWLRIQKLRVDGSGFTMCKTWDGILFFFFANVRRPKDWFIVKFASFFDFPLSIKCTWSLFGVYWWYESLCYMIMESEDLMWHSDLLVLFENHSCGKGVSFE